MEIHFGLDQFRSRFLALVVTVAVAACHGLLGAPHVAGDPLVGTGPAAVGFQAAEDFADNHGEMGPEGAASYHHGGTASGYFVVLLTVLLGSIFSLLRLSQTPRHPFKNTSLRRETRLRRVITKLPRGPTLSDIQVFRL